MKGFRDDKKRKEHYVVAKEGNAVLGLGSSPKP